MSTNERLIKFLQAPPDVLAQIDCILDGKRPTKVGTTANGPLLMGMGEGARLLGVSRATLWRRIKLGLLERIEILPGSFRVRRADLEAIAAGRKQELE
jgi:predicted DNA-binding transcriptional regulator AlpA